VEAGGAPEFALWLQRANDPSVSEQERLKCRALMDADLQERLRAAFKIAAAAAVADTANE
jgi:hypothetical protein